MQVGKLDIDRTIPSRMHQREGPENDYFLPEQETPHRRPAPDRMTGFLLTYFRKLCCDSLSAYKYYTIPKPQT